MRYLVPFIFAFCSLTAIGQNTIIKRPHIKKLAKGYANGHEYVDLGLSVKWATCNIGASSPTDYGQYFAWGEVYTKDKYTEYTYTFTEDVQQLDSNHDVASDLWGGRWRIPTASEFRELCNKCKWKWTKIRGITGYKVMGKNGAFIFLPSAGLWTSTRDNDNAREAYYLQLLEGCYRVYSAWRYSGLRVRPVFTNNNVGSPSRKQNKQSQSFSQSNNDKTQRAAKMPEERVSIASGYLNGHGYVDLGLPSGTLWATNNVDASGPEETGEEYAWGEIVSKTRFDGWDDYKYGTDYDRQTKYNLESMKGKVDYKTTLELTDDVAYMKWGTNWRIPSKGQFEELISYCTWRRFEHKGKEGFLIKGKNGKSIFLPIDTSGCYNINGLDVNNSSCAYNLVWTYHGPMNLKIVGGIKFGGRWVRPVAKP